MKYKENVYRWWCIPEIFFIHKIGKLVKFYNNIMSIIRTLFPLFGHLFVFVFDT